MVPNVSGREGIRCCSGSFHMTSLDSDPRPFWLQAERACRLQAKPSRRSNGRDISSKTWRPPWVPASGGSTARTRRLNFQGSHRCPSGLRRVSRWAHGFGGPFGDGFGRLGGWPQLSPASLSYQASVCGMPGGCINAKIPRCGPL